MGLTDKHLAYGDDIPQTQVEKDYYWKMANEKLINNEKYHTCGRCRYDCTPDDKYPCAACIHGTDHRTDLWELEPQSEQETNGSIFLKTYPNSHFSNVAYDDGICYIYVDLVGSRIRFTSDWWNASYQTNKEIRK